MFETNEFSIEGEEDLDNTFEEAFNTPPGTSFQMPRRSSGFQQYFENRHTTEGYDYDGEEEGEVEYSSEEREELMSEGELPVEMSNSKVCGRSLIIFIVLFSLSLMANGFAVYKMIRVNEERDVLQKELQRVREIKDSFEKKLQDDNAQFRRDLKRKEEEKTQDDATWDQERLETKNLQDKLDKMDKEWLEIVPQGEPVNNQYLEKAAGKGYCFILKFYQNLLEETGGYSRVNIILEAVKTKNVKAVQYLLDISSNERADDELKLWDESDEKNQEDSEYIGKIQDIVNFSLEHRLTELALNMYGVKLWEVEYKKDIIAWWLDDLPKYDVEEIKFLKQFELNTIGRKRMDEFEKRTERELQTIREHFGDSHEIVHFYETDILQTLSVS